MTKTTMPGEPIPAAPGSAANRERLRRALENPDASARLRAVLAAGSRPDPAYVPVLVARCAVEPDFSVRDMLTWALTRHPAQVVLPLLLDELRTGAARARSQALHTLSKIRDPRGWPAITRDLLLDPDDQVARSAWRAALVLVPEDQKAALAATLATQLGRGDREVRLSLSRALAGLGETADPVVARAAADEDAGVRAHALANRRLLRDPDRGFDDSLHEARRIAALTDAPVEGLSRSGDGGEAGADR